MKKKIQIIILIFSFFLNCFFLNCSELKEAITKTIDFNINGCYVGAVIDWKTFDDANPYETTENDLEEYEKIINKKVAVVSKFLAFSYSGVLYDFPSKFYEFVIKNNSIPMITWEPRDWNHSLDTYYKISLLPDILSGKYDKYIESWANSIKKLDSPIILRFAHEMNGNHYSWSGYKNGQGSTEKYHNTDITDGPMTYVLAYKYVYNFFKKLEVNNVIWVWSPQRDSIPNEPWNNYSKYYPGDEYVDLIAMDTYNWGISQSWSRWESFDEIFNNYYNELTKTYPDKTLIIGEFSSSDIGGNKAEWITDAFKKIKEKYHRIKLFIWFHINNRGVLVNNLKEDCNFCTDSDNQSKQAMRNAMLDSYYLDTVILKDKVIK